MTEKKIAEIKQELEQTPRDLLAERIAHYRGDQRAGVAALCKKYQKKLDDAAREDERLEKMLEFEKKYAMYHATCGIDEAGRGPLAGPVVAGAVILPKDCRIRYLNDSKQLTEKRRELLYDEIMEKAVAAGVGMASPARIDEINILQATYEAMRQAVGSLKIQPDILLNDAVTIPHLAVRQVAIVKGDARSLSIAAASVIAKVTRDRLMLEYDRLMPQYGFASHKGYGSAAHIEAIKKYGPSPIHRATFIKNFI